MFTLLLKQLITIAIACIWVSCNQHPKQNLGADEYFVCSMDPQVMEKQSGICPICKMELTLATIDKSQNDILKLNEEQIHLASIKIDSVRFGSIGREYLLNGIFNINQKNKMQISVRVNGRIDHLYYKIVGEEINVGVPIYELYSRDLLLAQEEYLLAINKSALLGKAASGLLASSKNKLLLWGLNESQITSLEQSKLATITTKIYSKISGTIMDIPLQEGDYVNEGAMIYSLADLSTLWLEAQRYSNEMENIQEGGLVDVIPQNYPEHRISGKIIFVNPEFQEQSKINLIRIEIKNNEHMFRPGMPANIILKSKTKKAIVLPLDAVIQSGEQSFVWMEIEKGKFKARRVQIGIQNNNEIEIISGLREGDAVVVSGAYALQSDFTFKHGSVNKTKED